MSMPIINETITSPTPFAYIIPVTCVSLALYVASGDVSFSVNADSAVWTGLTVGKKESFDGIIIEEMRGLTLTFKATDSPADLEIRPVLRVS
jgi:hypothetical protein